jgi:hypothetical protein
MEDGGAAAGSRSDQDSFKRIIEGFIADGPGGASARQNQSINAGNFDAMRTALEDPNAYEKTEKNDKIVIDAIYAQTELTAPDI